MSNLSNSQKNGVLSYIYINHPKEDHIGHLCFAPKSDLKERTGLTVDEIRETFNLLQSKGLLVLESENFYGFRFFPNEELYDFMYSGGF